MAISKLPLSYCTNLHPGLTVAAVLDGLENFTAPMSKAVGRPVAAGLWLAEPVTSALVATPDQLASFVDRVAELGLSCHTLNAFPYGNFHDERVKENVYVPSWAEESRLKYTKDCAQILARLLTEDRDGSISTVPLGFKEFDHAEDFLDRCIGHLIELANYLGELREETGKVIRLAIEPEPFCLLETTAEAVSFFDLLRSVAEDDGSLSLVNEHIGLCYDVCHQAVEFESIPDSFAMLEEAEIRINKLHISCAIELRDPSNNPAAREALANYAEPRYLHQTMALLKNGEIRRVVDLTRELALSPDDELLAAQTWRIHFHVPVNAESLGPLATTREELRQAIEAVGKLGYAPHLEVETYTWEVLPGEESVDLIDGLAREMVSTHELLATV